MSKNREQPINISKLFDLTGRVAIITGGAGMLGLKYAEAIAEMGGIPVLVDLKKESCQEAEQYIQSLFNGDVLGIQADVTEKSQIGQMVEQVMERFGRIDILVNNAAMDAKFDADHANQHLTEFENYPLAFWQRSLEVNLTGMFICAQKVTGPMLAQGKGVIVNISSHYGLIGPDQRLYKTVDSEGPMQYKPADYSVSKSGVNGLTRYLATYFAGKNIRVNSLVPGGVFSNHDPEFVRHYSYRTPLGRMATPNELCGPLVFLVSDASSYMTGANLVVDGGWTAW